MRIEPNKSGQGELTGEYKLAMLAAQGSVYMNQVLKQAKSKQSKGIKHARAIGLAVKGRV